MRRLRVVAAVLAIVVAWPLGAGAQDTPDPADWPARVGVDPGIDTTAHSLRIAGPSRYETAESIALTLHGSGAYPYGSPVNVDGSGWWGLDTCPYSVIVSAGDTPADALAAASLSDPTDQSSEPLLTRTSSADEFFAPVGARTRVDTDSAPIVLTASARQGADGLTAAARQTILDLSNGGCHTVRSAIVVGGTAAVPSGVDSDLLELGLDEVFRVAGDNRYDTAAEIARGLGTGEAVAAPTCLDANATDGGSQLGYYGNAAPEYRASARECTVLSRTVVLTDGVTGADALAAGWWTSRWQVPILLVDGQGELPAGTADALNSLVIDNVVVLGGSAAVPDSTVAEVVALTGATPVRVAGENRYETSVQMAGAFGGWFPGRVGANHDASLVCLAPSSGRGASAAGWPDALGAGPFCGAVAAGPTGTGTPAPVRGLPPVTGVHPRVSRAGPPSHQAAPVLLTPAASATLAPAVAELLAGTFDPSDVWCTSTQADDACLDPGFIVAFGGKGVLHQTALLQAADAVSGQTYVVLDDLDPTTSGGFWTGLDMAPIFESGGSADADVQRVCTQRGALRGARWLTAAGAATDLLVRGLFDAEGTVLPACVAFATESVETIVPAAVSLSGHRATLGPMQIAFEHQLVMTEALVQGPPTSADGTDPGQSEADGSVSHLTFADGGLAGFGITSRGDPAAIEGAGVDLTLRRPAVAGDPVRFEIGLSLATSLGSVLATASGEAVLVNGSGWELRGRTSFTGGSWNVASGAGGFRARLVTGKPGAGDETLTWRIDGLVAG